MDLKINDEITKTIRMNPNLFLQEKKQGSTTKVLKKLQVKPNNQSADFIAPPFAVGCEMACSYCLPAGTMISVPNGEKPIEQIQDGDPVIAFDNSTGQFVSTHAGQTAYRVVQELIELEVDGHTIQASLEHPFLVIRDGSRQWVEAQDLTIDDEVICY